MSGRLLWSPQAAADVEEILHFIAVEEKRPLIAERLAIEFIEACTSYADNSSFGQIEPRLPNRVDASLSSGG